MDCRIGCSRENGLVRPILRTAAASLQRLPICWAKSRTRRLAVPPCCWHRADKRRLPYFPDCPGSGRWNYFRERRCQNTIWANCIGLEHRRRNFFHPGRSAGLGPVYSDSSQRGNAPAGERRVSVFLQDLIEMDVFPVVITLLVAHSELRPLWEESNNEISSDCFNGYLQRPGK